MYRAFGIAIVLASLAIGSGASRASEVSGEGTPQLVAGNASGAATVSPAAWTPPPFYRGAASQWQAWRSAAPGAPRYWPYSERSSIADEAARKAYWRGWYDHGRLAAGIGGPWRQAQPAYPAYRDWSSRYQQRRSAHAGNLTYRGW